MQPLTPPPGSLLVQADMGRLRYQVTSWAQLGWGLVGGYLLVCAAVLTGALVLLAFLSVSTSAPLSSMMLIFFGGLGCAGAFFVVLTILVAWVLYPRLLVDVTLDGFGVTIESLRGRSRLLWRECSEVKREGRRLEVLSRGSWQPIPAPKSIEDVRWLEALVQNHIDARTGDESAPPPAVTAALEALQQRQ